ncbi:vWA domain-containing protein [Psychrobacter phenylpyruvicus]|uniref:Mg-chelatase subunit ChlD n=1 Tax=Psychrobacter phenylpyruvicus TaxID=29432 RepID=A0A379LLQ9_9GAMM|nr:VWA domain-containing protein [Psychrobacter phenylpyruvicus]SUD91549.1 Mg-chelatase subunit ChlD [Psychrobacter phenylpyruvicus]
MTSLSLCKRPLLLTSLTAITLSVLGGCSAQQDITNSDEPSKTTVHSPVVEVVEAAPIVVVASDATYERMAAPTHIRSAYTISSTQNSEKYAEIKHNAVNATHEQAFATLSIDTDTGSYANVRRFLNNGRLPPTDAVRVEELINYFNYDFKNAKKQGNAPFLVSTEVVKSPWHATNRIVKVGIKAEDVLTAKQNQPAANLVFLVDVSGSMNSSDKLPLAKSSLKILTKQLRAQDTITLITYAGNTEVVLPATPGNQTQKILNAIDNLSAHGSTNGEAAIKLAYQQAEANFKKNGINRILMLTDGDFNVGVSNVKDMLQIIRSNRDKGISLSTLGFGQGNYNDHMMEQVADNGNGNYSYIDSLSEAKKVLIDEMSSTFNTVAKDVKIQLEFNPAAVSEWRLIGYENRLLAKEDFNNDKVDAGELGAGKSVVALFEVTPVGQKGLLDASRYQKTALTNKNNSELGYLKIRYKAPKSETSKLLTFPIDNKVTTASVETKFAMAVAGYGQLLTGSKYVNDLTYEQVAQLAKPGLNSPLDKTNSRAEFIKLVELANDLQ